MKVKYISFHPKKKRKKKKKKRAEIWASISENTNNKAMDGVF